MIIWRIFVPKHKNFKYQYKTKKQVKKKLYQALHVFDIDFLLHYFHYFQAILN
jgi:hypothetical protein